MRNGFVASLAFSLCASAVVGVSGEDVALAHTVKQRVGAYADSQGLSRQRVGYDVGVENGASSRVPGLSGSAFNVSATLDQFSTEGEPSAYDEKVYGSTKRQSRSANVSASQVWDKLTETRVLGSFATDGAVKSRSYAAGVSQWVGRETVRLSIDVSRTIVEQPLFQILDYDFVEVGNPPLTTATGVSTALRHLATPTTMIDYQAGHVVTENRPATYSGGIGVRQFVPILDGALHVAGTRALNRGTITPDTTYGQVDAWIGDVSWLQNLWRGGLAKLGYRYYREDETTRAYEDEKVLGTDMITAGLSHEFKKGEVAASPVTVDLTGTRYLTNIDVAASSVELGVGARF
jgi:hypothetical protein